MLKEKADGRIDNSREKREGGVCLEKRKGNTKPNNSLLKKIRGIWTGKKSRIKTRNAE